MKYALFVCLFTSLTFGQRSGAVIHFRVGTTKIATDTAKKKPLKMARLISVRHKVKTLDTAKVTPLRGN